MKKNILSIAILVFGLSIVNAQTGNVGVNTPNPQETLHINGTFRLDNSSKGVDKILVSDANGTGTWKNIVTGGTVTNVTGTSPINVATGSTTPVVSLNNSGVTAGTYNGITVDAHGLVTAATQVTSAFGSLTTNGTSGVATLVGGVLNVPNYTYVLPVATTVLGGVKNGGNVTVNSDGTMTAPAGTVTSVAVTSPITNIGTSIAPNIGITRNNIVAGTTPSATASVPLTLDAGATNAVVGGANATFTINNTSPLWNANQLKGQTVNPGANTGEILTYNQSNNSWGPGPAAAKDWHITGNTDTINAPAALGSANAATNNFIGNATGNTTNLGIAVGGTTRAIVDNNGTLTGGGGASSGLTWGASNTIDTTSNNIALGQGNTAQSAVNALNPSVAIGTGNIVTGGGKAFGNNNTITNALSGFAFGNGNSISNKGGYAIGSSNTVNQGFAMGSGNNAGLDSFVFGTGGATTGTGQTVFANVQHLFTKSSGTAPDTRVGINVTAADLTADLNVKATIKIGSSTTSMASGTCTAANAGTIIFVSNSFYGCTGPATGWAKLNN